MWLESLGDRIQNVFEYFSVLAITATGLQWAAKGQETYEAFVARGESVISKARENEWSDAVAESQVAQPPAAKTDATKADAAKADATKAEKKTAPKPKATDTDA